MFIEAAGIRRTVLGADHPLTKKSERFAAESKQTIVLLIKVMRFEDDDRTDVPRTHTYHTHIQPHKLYSKQLVCPDVATSKYVIRRGAKNPQATN